MHFRVPRTPPQFLVDHRHCASSPSRRDCAFRHDPLPSGVGGDADRVYAEHARFGMHELPRRLYRSPTSPRNSSGRNNPARSHHGPRPRRHGSRFPHPQGFKPLIGRRPRTHHAATRASKAYLGQERPMGGVGTPRGRVQRGNARLVPTLSRAATTLAGRRQSSISGANRPGHPRVGLLNGIGPSATMTLAG